MQETRPSVLGGKKLDGYILNVDNISRGRFVEETNFELYLKVIDGEISEEPVVRGKYFSGRGKFYKPWLEIYYHDRVKFKSKIVDLSKEGLDEKLFNHLLNFLSLGSHIMVVYIGHEETRKGLERGVPVPATPLGHLLWKSGCMWFKDWYFAEGGLEGDLKLQGNKPADKESRKRGLLGIHKELTEFLKKEKREEKLFLDAKKRAENVLKNINGALTN